MNIELTEGEAALVHAALYRLKDHGSILFRKNVQETLAAIEAAMDPQEAAFCRDWANMATGDIL